MNKLTLICFLFFGLPTFSQIEKPKVCEEFTKNNNKRYKYINWTQYNNYNKSNSKNYFWKKTIIPIAFASTALSINHLPLKQNIQNKIRAPFNGYKTHLDDYIQYTPIGLMYGADMFKLKAKHSIWNQTKFLFFSELATGVIIFGLKYGIGIQRPDSSSFTSFPSGHTAQAFVTAQVLHNEFKSTHPLLAYSGYLFSASTGLLRIVNNKHWLPDVLMGAGIAIITTNLIYHFEPLKNWNPFKGKQTKFKQNDNKVNLMFTPTFSSNYSGLNIKLKL